MLHLQDCPGERQHNVITYYQQFHDNIAVVLKWLPNKSLIIANHKKLNRRYNNGTKIKLRKNHTVHRDMNRNEDTELKYLAHCLLCSGIPLLKSNCSFLRTDNAGYKQGIWLYSKVRIDALYGRNKLLFIKTHFYFSLLVKLVWGEEWSWGSRIILIRAGVI